MLKSCLKFKAIILKRKLNQSNYKNKNLKNQLKVLEMIRKKEKEIKTVKFSEDLQ